MDAHSYSHGQKAADASNQDSTTTSHKVEKPEVPPPPYAILDDWPTIQVISRRYIDQVLARTNNNKTRAAVILGIDRRTLNRILARERAKKAAAAKAAAAAAAKAG